MKNILLFYLLIAVSILSFSSVFGQSDVIISQYIETNSGTTPKGIEIFNVSGSDIVFSPTNNLEVQQGTNGASCGTLVNITSGTLSADEVWVIGSSNLTAYANTNGTNLSGTTTYGFSFNGDDALSVTLGGTIQDMFGVCGSDPGSNWSGGGVSTSNNNLEVKDAICDGDTDGWSDPSVRFNQIANGSTMTGFGDAPASCGGPSPTITVTPSSLPLLDYFFGSGPSSPQSYAIEGADLSPAAGNITITAPTNFEIATSAGGTYSGSLTIAYTGGALSSTTIYVRLQAGLAVNTYGPSDITNAGGGAASVAVSVSGEVYSILCNIASSGLANITCSDNATALDLGDDIISFELDPSGVNLGASYSVAVSGGGATSVTPTSGTYGSATTFTLNTGSAGGGNVTVTITDNVDGTCTFVETVTDPGICSAGAGCSSIFSDDFSGGLGSWSNTADWTTTGGELKHDLSSVSGTSYIYSDITNQNLASGDYEWEVCMRNGSWDPSSSNYFSFFLLSSQLNLSSLGTGYAVGINQNATNDLLTLYSVNSGTYTSIVTSGFNWDSGDDVCIRVTRSSTGTWELFYSANGGSEVSAGTTINTDFTSGQYIGAFFEYSSTRAGELWIDDVSVCSSAAATGPEIQLVDASAVNQACGSMSLDFGGIAPLTTTDLTFEIHNTGNTDLIISSYQLAGDLDFSYVGPVSYLVTPSGSTTVTLRFNAPLVTGVSNATLTIFSNDLDEGACNINLTAESTNTVPIPDNGCGSNEVSQTFVYSGGGGTVLDVNAFVSITHPWRGDLRIELESPIGTIVELLDGVGGSSDNLEVIFDDQVAGTLGTIDHTIDGAADESVQVTSGDLLADFNGENPNGTWILRVCDAAGGDVGFLEDWSLTIVENCVPTHAVSSIAPNEGPAGTHVTITGSGFTSGTTVTLNGAPVSILNQTATTLLVEVPSGANTAAFSVLESGCAIDSPIFTVLGQDGCTSSPGAWTGNLLISSVYDETSGSCHYIEIYNPTSSAIDLSTYELGSDNNAGNANNPPPGSYNGTVQSLSGTIQPFSTFMVRASSNGSTCNSCTNISADLNLLNFGFNGGGIDRVFLIHNGTEIDLWAQGQGFTDGFVYSRTSTSTAPSLTYSNADWDGQNTADCFGFEVEINIPPTIDPLTDINACSVVVNANVTDGEGGTLAYEWYYTDGTSNWSQLNSTSFVGLTITGDTTENLSIVSGSQSITNIDGYQFYLKVIEDTSCSQVSNAFLFTVEVDRYFRSAATGNWSNPDNWEMSTSSAGPWSSACLYPTETNSDYISIQPAADITLDIDLAADQIIIESGATLILDEKLTVNNGNALGSDLMVDGTLHDRGSTANGVEFIGGATWEYGSVGVVRKTWNSSVNQYRDNYEGGIASIPSTANWYFSYDGSGDVALSTIGMYYPNLFFESTSGDYDFDGFSEVFKGSSGTTVIKGDLNIGTTGSGNVSVYNNNTNSGYIQIEGDLNIASGSALSNEQVVFGPGDGTGAGFQISGGGTILGVFRNSYGTGNVVFNGTSVQTFFGFTVGVFETFDANVNNSSNVALHNIDLTITNVLTFVSGNIQTNISQIAAVNITNTSTSAIVGGTTNGLGNYVQGKLRWATDGSSTYNFPIGYLAPYYAQGISIDVTGTPGSTIEAFLAPNTQGLVESVAFCDLEAHPGGGTVNAGNGVVGYDGVNDRIEFNLQSPLRWNVTNPSGGVSSYDIAVFANGLQDISPVTTANGEEVRFLMKDGEPGNTGFPTITGAPSWPMEVGFDACPNQYTLAGMTDFSNFTLNGANQSNTTLPVELIYLDAKGIENRFIEVTWATATEINNNGFEIQRSEDGIGFQTIGWVEGNGNSQSTLTYHYNDHEVKEGVTYYYRLKQIDFNGDFELTEIVSARIGANNAIVRIIPTVTNDFIQVSANESIEEILVYDITGKRLSGLVTVSNNAASIDLSAMASGVYVISVATETSHESYKVIKQ